MKRGQPLLAVDIALTTIAACGNGDPKPNQATATTSSVAAAPSAASVTGLAECDDYLKAVDKFLACPGLPEGMREDTVRSKKKFEARWTNASEEKQALAKACKVAADAARSNIQGFCNPP